MVDSMDLPCRRRFDEAIHRPDGRDPSLEFGEQFGRVAANYCRVGVLAIGDQRFPSVEKLVQSVFIQIHRRNIEVKAEGSTLPLLYSNIQRRLWRERP
jgi:hypothetical protein